MKRNLMGRVRRELKESKDGKERKRKDDKKKQT